MADEAVNCFTSLLESVPRWIAELESILRSATERQNEILFENQPTDSEQVIKKRLSKSSSLRSRPVDDDKPEEEKATQDGPTLLRPQLPHMTPSDALRLSQRKRKTASACSARQSGPVKYRSRSMVVIYYDGETQRRFESLVRAIGTCRNALRRGKVNTKVDILSRSDPADSEGYSGEDALKNMRKLAYKPARLRGTAALIRNDGTEVFDKVDTFLEKAQALCERAAHQVLRDGDCGLEIRNVKEHFTDAQKLAEAELPELAKRAEQAAERRRRSDERKKAEANDDEKRRQQDGSSHEKLVNNDNPFNSSTTLEVDLEADGSDGDDGAEYTLSALQMSKFGMRSSRLAAH